MSESPHVGKTLAELLAAAESADGLTRIDFRDPIAAFGADAIRALEPWLQSPRLAAFAARTIAAAAPLAPEEARAALRRGRASAPPAIAADIGAVLAGLSGGQRPQAGNGSSPPPLRPGWDVSHADGLARRLTDLFVEGRLDLSKRPGRPPQGWDAMPEFAAAGELRAAGATDPEVRLWLTFTVALDKIRDADSLAEASGRLWKRERWAFEPEEVVRRGPTAVASVLRASGVSKLHAPDADAWFRIAQSLAGGLSEPVTEAIYAGRGDVPRLVAEVERRDATGSALFPSLRGPKISQLWIRELVVPGNALIGRMDRLGVAVDVQVRKVTENLGVLATRGQPLEAVRGAIQRAWAEDIRAHGAAGPDGIRDTAGALDPALWFFGKWGCTYCQEQRRQIPIADVCSRCTPAFT
jgi:hypothetical protein